MKYYADKFNVSTLPSQTREYEVLNELKSAHRSDDNCLYHTRFLFESDSLSLMEQVKYASRLKNEIMRVTFSGKKSVHIIMEFPTKYEKFCSVHYKLIWKYINLSCFDGNCDKACANPSRLTRCPNVVRKDTGKVQTLLYDGKNYISDKLCEDCMKYVVEEESRIKNFYALSKRYRSYMESSDKVDCSEWNVVKRYLETPFPHMTGNGNSSSWLYAAIQTCMQYSDNDTLDKVLDKARSENWTEKELEHKMK